MTFATVSIDSSQNPDLEKLVLWDAATGGQVRTLVSDAPGLNAVNNLSFSKDGRWLVSHAGGIVRIFDVETGQEVRRLLPPPAPSGLEPAASLLSPDGKRLVAHYRVFNPPDFYHVIQGYELDTGHEVALDSNVYRDWRFAPDSMMLAISASTDVGKITQRAVAEIWDTATWTRKRVIEAPSGWQGVFTVDLSPDGQIVAIGGRGMFGLFSVETGELLVEKFHPSGSSDSVLYYDLTWIEFSPDGKSLLTGGNDGTVKLWKIKQKSTQ